MIDSTMALSRPCNLFAMKTLLLFLQISLVLGAEYVPVLIWETHSISARDVPHFSPLSKLSSDEFSDYITKKVTGKAGTKPVIAAFVEENLSVEDFSSQNGENRNTFPHLENLTSAASHSEFLPSVHSPLKGLKRLGYLWQNYQVENGNDVSLPDNSGVVLVVKLGDAKTDESRPDFLKRHDQIISDTFKDLDSRYEDKEVIGIYTSRHSSWIEPDYETVERRRRSLLAVDGDPGDVWSAGSALFYTSITPILSVNGTEYNFTGVGCTKNSKKVDDGETLTVRCKSTVFTAIFKFILGATKYWNVSVSLEESGKPEIPLATTLDIYAPQGFSYHCAQVVEFKNKNKNDTAVIFTFHKLQLQPFLSDLVFGDSYDCVWFFTVPIWAGLAVTALLGLILMWGLTMIMDIKTMDRFDDPKGKPLTINVSE